MPTIKVKAKDVKTLSFQEFESVISEITIDGKLFYDNFTVQDLENIYNAYLKTLSYTLGDSNLKFIINEYIMQYYIPVTIQYLKYNTKANADKQQVKTSKLKNILKKQEQNRFIKKTDTSKVPELDIKASFSIELNYNTLHMDVRIETVKDTNIRYFMRNFNRYTLMRYNNLIIPSHNISNRLTYSEKQVPQRHIKDILVQGFYDSNDPVSGEYISFLVSHIYKLGDNRTILPVVYPFYGRKTGMKDKILHSEDLNLDIYEDLYNYIYNSIQVASNVLSVFNNVIYRYYPSIEKEVFGEGNIGSVKSLVNISNIIYDKKLPIKSIHEQKLEDIFSIYSSLKLFELDDIFHISHNDTEYTKLIDTWLYKAKSMKQVYEQSNSVILEQSKQTIIDYLSNKLFSIDYKLLNEDKKRLVMKAFERRQLKHSQIIGNTCMHTKLVRTLPESFNNLLSYLSVPASISKAQITSDLDIQNEGKNALELLNCNNCKLPVICPHLYNLYMFENTHITQYERKTNTILQDIREFLIRNYAMDGGHGHIYYCKICGEKLAEDTKELYVMPAVDYSGDVIIPIEEDTIKDEINKLIYTYVSQIIKSNVKFTSLIDPKIIINNVSRMIKHELLNINTKLNTMISKGKSLDELNPKLNTYAFIYSLMGIMVISLHRPGDLKLLDTSSMKQLKNSSMGGSIDQKNLKQSFDVASSIIKSNKSFFDKYELTLENIKNIMVKAYKVASGYTINTQTLPLINPLNTLLTLDPLYKYIHRLLNVYVYNGKLSFDDTEKVIGLRPEDILNGKYKNPTYNIEILSKLDGNKLDDFGKFKVQVLKDLIGTYIKNGIYNYVPDHINRVEYNTQSLKLNDAERELYADKQTIKPHKKTISKKIISRRYPGYIEPKLNYKYTNDGKERKWDRFLYKDGKTFKLGDDAMIPRGSNTMKDLVSDGLKKSSISKQDNKKIQGALDINDLITNFYRYYQFRCPESGVHTFNNDGVCKKCNITYTNIKNNDAGFYKKYSSIFSKSKQTKVVGSMIEKRIPPSNHLSETTVDKKYHNIVFVQEASNKLSINTNVLANIGLMEDELITNIRNKQVNPYETLLKDTKDKTLYMVYNEPVYKKRIFRIKTYINNLLVYTNLIRIGEYVELPFKLQEVLKKDISKIGLNKELMKKALPNISETFKKLDTMIGSKREFSNMYLYELLRNMLEIWKASSLGKTFIEWFSKNIVHNENLLSMYDEDMLRRERNERYEQIMNQYNRTIDDTANTENLEIIKMYDEDFVRENNLEAEVADSMADSSYEMTIEVDEENEIEATDD